MGFLNEFGHVWETMEDVSGDAHFLNASFEPHPSNHAPYIPSNVLSTQTTSEVNEL